MGIEQRLATDSDKVTLTLLQDFLHLFRFDDQAYAHRLDPNGMSTPNGTHRIKASVVPHVIDVEIGRMPKIHYTGTARPGKPSSCDRAGPRNGMLRQFRAVEGRRDTTLCLLGGLRAVTRRRSCRG